MHDSAARRVKGIWRDVLLLGLPLPFTVILAGSHFGYAQLDAGCSIEFSSAAYWSLVTVIMLAGLIGGKLLGDRLLSPKAIANKKISLIEDDDYTMAERAEKCIRERLFIQLNVLDLPAIVIFLYGVLSGDHTSLVLAIIYCFVAFVTMRTDAEALMDETVNELERRNFS